MSDVVIYIFVGGGPTAIFSVLLLYLFLYPDKYEHLAAIFYQILHGASWYLPKIKGKFDRRAVTSSIQDTVNGVGERLNKEAPDILPHALKIEWVQSESPDAFIKDGKAVVRLKHYANQDRNIVDATLLYLKVDLLPRAKNCLDKTLRKSCECKVAAQIFAVRRDTGAYDYFVENELTPAISSDAKFEQDLQMLDDIDSIGFLTRVFLEEVKQTGEKLLGALPKPAIQEELRDFAEFLQTIANKGEDEDVPLTFKGAKVKVAVVLVAKRETIETYGIDPYIRRISRNVREGYETIYISGWGEDFVKKVIEIKKVIEGKIVNVIRPHINYPIRGQVNGILLACQSNPRHLAQQRELRDDLKQAMIDLFPEIANGKIEIVSIGRRKDIGCKVVVRSVSTEEIADPVSILTSGNNAGRFDELKSSFPNEMIEIIPWSSDIEVFVINALQPLNKQDVTSVNLDEANLVAIVEVSNSEAYRKAIGRDGYNVNLVEELTGWQIILKMIRSPEGKIEKTTKIVESAAQLHEEEAPTGVLKLKYLGKVLTEDDDLKEKVTAHVPEIKNNEIEIVRLARIAKKGSMLIVKWKNGDNITPADKVCRGLGNSRLNGIRKELKHERVYIWEWCEDPEEFIMKCLWPLEKPDVVSINLNEDENTAIVTVDNLKKISKSFNKAHLGLIESVTQRSIEFKERTK
jgi:transcription antitermination factor NusA-like protein